ncbi:transcription initiation factor IIB family protein [Halalkalicoccus sp. NIPERK01]|uniref:transcription initiation factor IIB n=1 Tax=Halalkalicoccus sp. NIPERK01 TaxID=3053469 RepID=UPI00256F54E3|nr:transcription initiation factor IIB family protein [Halalkalicoccus sp. NIPERK01]MDL5363886.1 transcription initiation factor IIB family protein [Halalkalicoccus sp. NIPERK01]
MSSTSFVRYESSVEQVSENSEASEESVVEREPAQASTCVECDGRVITEDNESFCVGCGLIVSAEHVDHRPTRGVHGPSDGSGPVEWSCESINPLRIDKGMHTTFFLGSDGYGRSLTSEKKDKFERLRQRHKRFQVEDKRAIRLNEGFRDIESITGNLALPGFVAEDAGLFLKQAADARLPGGRMSWEALAGGAVLLAALDAEFPRSCEEVAQYAKAGRERLCAAARKLRCELELDVPPVREAPVDAVVAALGEAAPDVEACLRLRRIGAHLLEIADEAPIGPGTSRVTMAAAAVYAADRLTEGKALTQAEVVAAGTTILDTTKSRVSRYSQALHDAYVDRHGTNDPAAVLKRSRVQLH